MTGRARGHYVVRTGKLICEEIAKGKTLQQALDAVGYLAPTIVQFWRWLEEHPDFRDKYDHARQLSADLDADRIKELAENVIKNPKSSNAYRVAITALQWQAEVRNSAKYGKNKESKAQKPMDATKLRGEIKRLEKELGVVEAKVVPFKVVGE